MREGFFEWLGICLHDLFRHVLKESRSAHIFGNLIEISDLLPSDSRHRSISLPHILSFTQRHEGNYVGKLCCAARETS